METRLRRTIPVGGRCGRCQGLRGRLYLCFLSSCIAASDILPESCIFNNISTSDRFSPNWIYISFSVFFFCLFFCTYTYDHTSKCWYIILRIVFPHNRRDRLNNIWDDCRLFTVPYFFVRSFRYTTSYRHGYLDFQRYRRGGRLFSLRRSCGNQKSP